MGSRFPSHQLSNGLYVSGRPEQPKERTPTMSSVAMPYTGGDIKKSGELGKMFDIPVDGSKSRKSGPISGAPSRTGSFGGAASHSGPIMPTAAPRAGYTTSGPGPTGGMSGSASLKKSNSGPLNRHGDPVKRTSGPQSGGLTSNGRQNSGPIPVLPATGLITSGPISSGPLNSSGAPRKASGPLDSVGSMKVHGSAVNLLNHDDDEFSFKRNFPKPILWSLVLLFVMGFIAGGFILGAVHNAILLIVVVILFGTVAALFAWNSCWGRRAIMGFIAHYPDAELRNAKNGQFVKISGVHSHVDIYNFTDNTWGGRFDMPKEMAHSHLGMVTDGRYIYIVTGQYGPQCRGPTAHTFILDTETKKWSDMPPLPVPRYAPATQLWRGRLHVMGGSKENRHTPGLEHWSLAVKDGKALETEWRSEIPIPRGGPHRACVVFKDRLYVIGGQEGDFMAKPGSPIFKCSRRMEMVYSDVYMLDDDMKWKTLPPMPKPDSHIEFAWAIVNNSIVISGGTTEKHPITKKMILVGEVFQFNFDTLEWSVIGKLPYRVKTTLVGFWQGWLYFTSGQRDKGPDDPAPRKVIGEMWRTRLKLNS